MKNKSDLLAAIQLRIQFCQAHGFTKYIPGLKEAYTLISRDMLPHDEKVKSL